MLGGLLAVYFTHSGLPLPLSLLLAMADRGYVLETGTVTLTGSGEDLIHNEQVRAVYLGM